MNIKVKTVDNLREYGYMLDGIGAKYRAIAHGYAIIIDSESDAQTWVVDRGIEHASALFSGVECDTLDLSDFYTGNIKTADHMFFKIKVKEELILGEFNVEKIEEADGMFSQVRLHKLDLSGHNFSKLKSVVQMFEFSKIDELDLSDVQMEKVAYTERMFLGSMFGKLNIENLNLRKATRLSKMFMSCAVENLIGLDSIRTDSVEDVSNMFRISDIKPRDIAIKFNTSKVYDAYGMFAGSKFTSIDTSELKMSCLVEASEMFLSIKVPVIDISNLNLKDIDNAKSMFSSSTIGKIKFGSTELLCSMSCERMFSELTTHELDLSCIHTIPELANVSNMFDDSNIEKIILTGLTKVSAYSLGSMLNGYSRGTVYFADSANIHKAVGEVAAIPGRIIANYRYVHSSTDKENKDAATRLMADGRLVCRRCFGEIVNGVCMSCHRDVK